MKRLSILLLVVMVSLSSCAINEEKETAKESGSTSFQPKPLDDDWFKWLVGEWEGLFESDVGTGKIRTKIELGLNGQFLIMKTEAKTTEITDEQRQYLRDTLRASDEDIKRYRSSTSKELQIHTIDPETSEVIGYLFDSFRCVAEGRGRRQGNKEIIEWKWSATGHRKKHRKAFQNTNHSTTNCDIVKLGKNSVAPTRKWLYYVGSI